MSSNNTSYNLYNDTNKTVTSGLTENERMELLEFENKLELAKKIILIFIAIFTVSGNSLVLLVTWKDKSLHQPNKYFIACLAFADLLVGILVAPLQVHQLNPDDKFLRAISISLCQFMVWVDIFALIASIFSLTLISFDRYLKISQPLRYESKMTTSKSLKMIFSIWFIATAFATYAATPHSGSWGVLVLRSYCPFDRTKTKGFCIFLGISAFYLPTGLITVMYTLIFLTAHKRQKMLRSGELGQTCGDRKQRTVFLQDLKVIRMLLVVVGVFVICWGPYFIFRTFHHYNFNFNYQDRSIINLRRIFTTELIIRTFPYFNSLCNPVIYACLDRKYRKALKHLFQGMICRRRTTA